LFVTLTFVSVAMEAVRIKTPERMLWCELTFVKLT